MTGLADRVPVDWSGMGNQRVRITMWVLSAVALVLGFYIGFNVNADVGGLLWLASAALALAPFASHRNPS